MNWVEKRIFDILLPYFQHQESMMEKEYIHWVLRERLLNENSENEEIKKLIEQEESLRKLVKTLNEKKKEEANKLDELIVSQERYKVEETEFNKKIQEIKKTLTENEEIFSEESEVLNAMKEKVLKENEEIKKLNKEKEKNISKISSLELENVKLDDEINKIVMKEIEEQYKSYEEKVKIYLESREHLEKLQELKEESLWDTYKDIANELKEWGNSEYWAIEQKIAQYKEQIKETKEQADDTFTMIDTELMKIEPNFERISNELEQMYATDVEAKKEAKQKAETLAEQFNVIGKARIWVQSVTIKS